MSNLDILIGWLERILEVLKKYSLISILKAIGLGWLIYLSFNPSIVIDYCERKREEAHKEQIERRIDVSSKVQIQLDRLLLKTNATRAFFIDFHNGAKNLNNLPYLKGIMLYETVKGDLDYVSDFYKDFSLTNFPFILSLFKEKKFIGKVELIQSTDNRLYRLLTYNKAQYIGLIVIEGENDIAGLLGITYTSIPEDKNRCEIYLESTANQLKQILK